MSKRYFINNLDTPFGQEFYEFLVKEDTEEGVHMATYKDESRLDVPKGFKKILKRAKPKLSRKKLLEECDVYVYDLETISPNDIDYITTVLKAATLEEQKVLIIVSSILTWSDMGKKIKVKEEKPIEEVEGEAPPEQPPKEPEEQENNENPEDEEQQQLPTEVKEEVPIVEEIVYTFWEEGDYKQRNAKAKYQYLKDLEEQALSIAKENLKVIVVAGGLRYGKGEQLFFKYFKKAWLQEPYKLSYPGDNFIPTIHVTDLVKMISKVSETIPEQNYILAVDNTEDKSSKAVIQGIATGVGSGWIEQSQDFFNDFTENERDYLTLNLECKTGALFVGNADNPADYEWHCEKGIAANAKKILAEFNKVHKHRPIKLIMYCNNENMRFQEIVSMIAKHYRIPILTQQQIFKDARDRNFSFPPEILEDFNEYYDIIQEYIKSQKPQALSEPLKIYYKVVKWRLSQNDCANRGFILENFPLLTEECDLIFYPNKAKLKMKKKPKKIIPKEQVPPKEAGEDNEENNPDNAKDEEPKEEEPIEEELKEEEPEEPEPEEEVLEEEEGGPKSELYFPESIIIVKPTESKQVVMSYFSETVDAYYLDSRLRNNSDVLENLRMFIERNGQPNNYLLNERVLIERYFAYQRVKDLSIKHTRKQVLHLWRDCLTKNSNAKREMMEKHLKYIAEHEQELEKVKLFPFRNFLIEYVVPVLNEGLVEVAQTLPDDPVEFLAEYLYARSFEVDN